MFGAASQPAQTATVEVDPRAHEDARRRAWRLRRFREIGFSDVVAELLADSHVDWHDAKDLRDRGCPLLIIYRLLI